VADGAAIRTQVSWARTPAAEARRLDHCKHILVEGVRCRTRRCGNCSLLLCDVTFGISRSWRPPIAQHGRHRSLLLVKLASARRFRRGDDNIAASRRDRLSGPDAQAATSRSPIAPSWHGHGLSVGSEMRGGARNIRARSIHFDGTTRNPREGEPRPRQRCGSADLPRH